MTQLAQFWIVIPWVDDYLCLRWFRTMMSVNQVIVQCRRQLGYDVHEERRSPSNQSGFPSNACRGACLSTTACG
jgi:hypothetical protein